MGKWFDQAREIERLRQENQRLQSLVALLNARLGDDAPDDPFGVSAQERYLASEGRKIEAIKAYRERTGANLLNAKNAIDSVS